MGDFMNDLTQGAVKAFFDYEPETGALIWRQRVPCTREDKIFNTRWAGTYAGCEALARISDGEVRQYRQVRAMGKLYLAHRLIWLWMTGEWPTQLVDHWDLDGLNNRWRNLRLADWAQNQANRKPRVDNCIGLKGVRHHRDGRRYQARITMASRSVHLGLFDTAEDAAAAYDAAITKRHGEFARTNSATS